MLLIAAFFLLLLLPYPWNVIGFAAATAAFVGELVFWNHTMRGRRQEVGVETLVGRTATVVSPCTPVGQVRVAGETWAARCEAGAARGETVTVTAVDELLLIVESHA